MTAKEEKEYIESRLSKGDDPINILYDLIDRLEKEISLRNIVSDCMTDDVVEKANEDIRIFNENKEVIYFEMLWDIHDLYEEKGMEAITWLEENFDVFPKESILKMYRK